MKKRIVIESGKQVLSAAMLVMMLGIGFILLEPTVSRSQINDDFTVTQTINTALAFLVNPNDVDMDASIDGLTGGSAYGTTTTRIRTNNAAGYTMTIQFSSTTAMIRNGGGGRINNYLYSTGTASYPTGFDVTPVNAQFGFTVNASTTADISTVFTDNGAGVCGTGNNGNFTFANCWRGASSTDETFETELLNTSGPTAASGSTSTIHFRVTLPPNPTPAVPNGTYVATATLTATEN